MYFAEWGKLRTVLSARGKSSAEIEAHRAAITLKALGRPKSSKLFTNADLDKVLAAIKAEAAPGDFAAQMKVQDSPEKRRELLLARIRSLSLSVGLNAGHESTYVDGIARRMFGRQYHELEERGLQQIEGILQRRLQQLGGTVEQIQEIEREVVAEGAKVLEILAPEFTKTAATPLVAGEDF